MKNRIIFYIDGLNLYQGLKKAGLQDYYWLDVVKLSRLLTKDYQKLERIKYFTSMFSEINTCKLHWQTIYLNALNTFNNLDILKGRHQQIQIPKKCKNCNRAHVRYEEKLTDVNIVCEMFDDAYYDNCDVMGLISADCDLRPAVQKIIKLYPKIQIITLFPPERYCVELKNYCSACRVIGRKIIKKCKLPDFIKKKNGTIIYNPTKYNKYNKT
jgi:uncharacterized LabA/DUF88 family protein